MSGRISRLLSVLVFSIMTAIFALGGSSAAASDTGWVPDGPYPDVDIEACDTTLTIHPVVTRVERRERTDAKGDTRTDYRGTYIVRVSAPDGRATVLNNSGAYSVLEARNGDVFEAIFSPALVYAFTPEEADVFAAAGLPEAFYYTQGRLDLYFHSDFEKVVTKPANPVSICALL